MQNLQIIQFFLQQTIGSLMQVLPGQCCQLVCVLANRRYANRSGPVVVHVRLLEGIQL